MVVSAQGEPVWAARLWGSAEALREKIDERLSPVEQAFFESAIKSTRSHLGERAFMAAWAEGRMMTPDQTLRQQQPIIASPASSSTPGSGRKLISHLAGLTTREVEVLRQVARGLTNEQVAERLVISPRTVDTHLTSIYSKIGVSSRTAATRYTLDHHLV
ncbi:MAG: hypothetical protein H0U76_03535 [Ktedonobacteraceae bacterium]|nr:hypothetical protein [Ktedonobacteraceae bacterium]